MVGLVIIFFAIFVCLFGYIIAPDASIDADLQTVEIQSKPIGYTQQFLKIPINKNSDQSFLSTLFFGKEIKDKSVSGSLHSISLWQPISPMIAETRSMMLFIWWIVNGFISLPIVNKDMSFLLENNTIKY